MATNGPEKKADWLPNRRAQTGTIEGIAYAAERPSVRAVPVRWWQRFVDDVGQFLDRWALPDELFDRIDRYLAALPLYYN